MRRVVLSLGLMGGLCLAAGCSIAGDWRTMEQEQAGKHFPFYQVKFGEDGHYTAKGNPKGKEVTSTGEYKWNGTQLKIMPKDGPERAYSGMHDAFKNQLKLTYEHDGQKMSATLEKVESQPK